MSTSPKLLQRLVLYIDILGFSALTNRMRTDEKNSTLKTVAFYESISDKLASLPHKLPEISGLSSKYRKFTPKSIQWSHFSDTIVISIDTISPPAVCFMCEVANLIFDHLCMNGLAARGALHCGDLYHEGNQIIGPALIDAYYLESNCAIYPRVILSQELCYNLPLDGLSDLASISLSFDDGDFYHIDWISKRHGWLESLTPDDLRKNAEIIVAHVIHCAELIRAGINDNNPKVRQKYIWLMSKCTRFVMELSVLGHAHDIKGLAQLSIFEQVYSS